MFDFKATSTKIQGGIFSIDQIAQDLLTLHREQSVSRSFSSQYSASGA